tara:strand:- start:977 stop:1357 length:381 start_codon:yes stop_codon:yes gene_type:complete
MIVAGTKKAPISALGTSQHPIIRGRALTARFTSQRNFRGALATELSILVVAVLVLWRRQDTIRDTLLTATLALQPRQETRSRTGLSQSAIDTLLRPIDTTKNAAQIIKFFIKNSPLKKLFPIRYGI